ncbi:hypothetical protein [uncultured Sphingomonas sp.]|uniref:hypothetical protein n=1 Tax=uncultured Sphingomonas sp. TaxID=158754 RepID=UPI0035CBE76D
MTDKLKIAGLALALTFSTAAVSAECCKDMACCKEGADCCEESKGKQDAHAEHAGDHAAHA